MSLSKNFDNVIKFHCVMSPSGQSIWLPLVSIILIAPSGIRFTLPLIFDTGASVTTLRSDLYPLLGLTSWDQGTKIQTATASAVVDVFQYRCTIEVFGKQINCPVNLMHLPQNPLYCGLFGRDTVFENFGFGFWESSHEIYVSLTP